MAYTFYPVRWATPNKIKVGQAIHAEEKIKFSVPPPKLELGHMRWAAHAHFKSPFKLIFITQFMCDNFPKID